MVQILIEERYEIISMWKCKGGKGNPPKGRQIHYPLETVNIYETKSSCRDYLRQEHTNEGGRFLLNIEIKKYLRG